MENIIKRYENSFRQNAPLPAITDYTTGITYSYSQMAQKIAYIHSLLKEEGVNKGDKVALIGKNSANWICIYIGVMTYGAVIVPILADFNPMDVSGIVNHSDSVVLFADNALLDRIDTASCDRIRKSITIESLSDSPVDESWDVSRISYDYRDFSELAAISYTSGTSGTSKGVMLSIRGYSFVVDFTISKHFHTRGSHVLSMLPLAHAYGCAFDMLTPLAMGSQIFVLRKIPTPGIILKALKTTRPQLLCTVPLVMEKLIRKNVFPQLEQQPVRTLLKLPVLRNIVYRKIRASLLDALGGNIMEVNMGGGALDPEVEDFLLKIRFPFTVGYGMTECCPLISYSGWKEFKKGSCGTLLDGMEMKIDSQSRNDGTGEICVKGPNVMLGYFKNGQATQSALQDGWLRTGDIGYVDKDNALFLKGRCKTMILTSAGQNIYPEEIESKLNKLPLVAESLVYEHGGKIYAIVYPDEDSMKTDGLHSVAEKMKENLKRLNSIVAPYEKVAQIKLCSKPFEKTPKQSIKRYLYPEAATILE